MDRGGLVEPGTTPDRSRHVHFSDSFSPPDAARRPSEDSQLGGSRPGRRRVDCRGPPVSPSAGCPRESVVAAIAFALGLGAARTSWAGLVFGQVVGPAPKS